MFILFMTETSLCFSLLYVRGTTAVTVFSAISHTGAAPLALSMQAAGVSKAVLIGNPTFLTLSIH